MKSHVDCSCNLQTGEISANSIVGTETFRNFASRVFKQVEVVVIVLHITNCHKFTVITHMVYKLF